VAHVADASAVRAVIEAERLERALAPALFAAAHELGLDALALALSGGEDYALVACGPARRRPRFARVIGRVEAGRGAVLERVSGTCVALAPGFDHLARATTYTPPAAPRRAARRSRSR
jgi:thiamine-monophosphate kinase